MRVILMSIVCLSACLALPSGAEELRIEAESFAESGNLSQLPIQGVNNPACSGGVSLVGLDTAGEWTTYDDLAIPRAGTYSLFVHFRAEAGQPVVLRLSLVRESGPGASSSAGSAGSEAAAPAAGQGAARDVELSLHGDGFG